MIGVCIVTYNQEQYIAQCIESVLMQEPCGHKVVAYIGDDCSTDNTLTICEEIANRAKRENLKDKNIKVIHNEKNLGLVGNTMNLLDIMRKDGCEYIAMLDGDDYWSDCKKLQKQMAYFEQHPEYGLVHTYVDLLWPDGIRRYPKRYVPEGNVFQYMGHSYPIANCSVVFRTQLLDMIDFDDFQRHGLLSCDYSMYAIFASKCQIGFIPDYTGVWRRGIESVSGTSDMERQIRYVYNELAHWRYLAKLFPHRWTYTEEDGNAYLHMCAFNIAFRFGDCERAMYEAQLMSQEDRSNHWFKIACTHSWLLFNIYRWVQYTRNQIGIYKFRYV